MSATTTTEVPQAVNVFYDRQLLVNAMPLFVHAKMAQIRDIPQNAGDTIKFRRYSLLAAATTPLDEGVTPAGSQLSVTDITAQINQYGDFITLTDKLLFTTLDPILTETAEILGEQAGDTLDRIARDIFSAGTTIQYASTAAVRTDITAAMVLDKATILKAVRTLKRNNARKLTSMVNPSQGFNTNPINAAYIAIVHPNTTYDLKSATGWIPVENYASQADVMQGEVGKIDEVRFVESTNAKVFVGGGSGGADVYATIVFAANAVGITRVTGESLRNIIKPLGSAGTADPLDQRATSGWKATFAAKILNQTFMVRIEHGVTA